MIFQLDLDWDHQVFFVFHLLKLFLKCLVYKKVKWNIKIVKNIEIKELKSPIGVQDYLPGIYGGFNGFFLE